MTAATTRTPARAQLTPWYPASIKPHRPGWYEIRYTWQSCPEMLYWSGRDWLVSPMSQCSIFGWDGDEWRGQVSPHTATVLAAADACMSPDQRALFGKIGANDPDVYARLFAGIVARYLAQVAK